MLVAALIEGADAFGLYGDGNGTPVSVIRIEGEGTRDTGHHSEHVSRPHMVYLEHAAGMDRIDPILVGEGRGDDEDGCNTDKNKKVVPS